MRADIKERIAMIERGEVPEGYKKTRFGIIPHKWGICPTQHIGLWFGGYAFKSEEFLNEAKPNTVQVIKMGNVKMCRLELSTNPAYLEIGKINNGLTKYMLKTGDILITLTGTVNKTDYGNVAYISENGKYVLNQRVGCLRIENAQEKSYYYYYFQSRLFRRDFFILGVGGTGNQANVSTADLSMLQVTKPPSIEQKKIAQILTLWDRALELKEKLLEQKKLQKKGLMERLLTGKVRLPGFKDGWITKNLKEISKRKTKTSGDRNIPVLTISSLSGFLLQNERFSKVIAGENLSKYIMLEENEFSYNKGNSKKYPYGCIFRLESYSVALVPNVYYSFALPGQNTKFYKYYFEAGLINRQLRRVINTGVRNDGLLNLDVADFFNIQVLVPPTSEQEKIAQVLETIDHQIINLEKNLEFLKAQKKGLMQLLLTGKVRVPS